MAADIKRLFCCIYIAAAASVSFADDRVLDALAGLVKIDSGIYKAVVLLPGQGPVANYCGENWSYGFIREGYADPMHAGAKISLPGCWGGLGDPASRNFEFRYMNPAKAGVFSFSLNIDELKRLKYDTETDEVISAY